ncbi:MAG: alpha/beta hydrolase [Lachnospiraceae bacterium]|nr:alpha/beta hydrolase [Lachnospiraceae bacterium]
MNLQKIQLTVPGQQTGAAVLTTYLLDGISAVPEKQRPAVIVVPGGGYSFCSDREGEPIVMQFLAMGYQAFLLDYSVAPNHFPVALQELGLAVATVREHAAQWHVNPQAVLVCGFSAGGHLACSLGTFWNRAQIFELIERTPKEVRPDGLILGYPVITAGAFRHDGSFESLLGVDLSGDMGSDEMVLTEKALSVVSLEQQVSEQMPPVFLWHTLADQSVPVENSLLLANAMRRNGVEFELHIYPEGRHGLALANEETGGNDKTLTVPCCQTWISLVQLWIGNHFKK